MLSLISAVRLAPVASGERQHWAEFGTWLEGERKGRALTKADAAKAAGVSLSTWTTIEAGGRTWKGQWVLPSPNDLTLVGIADALGLPRQEVWQRAGRLGLAPGWADRDGRSNDALSGKFSRLSEDDRRYVEGLVDRLLGEER